ncbi:efflux RND transporter periplasmic adaptor subunit [Larkinella terrae]|uniref:Efflux RND transporter periplasmic adaptor subunit n=1 Tax=Larkinella terrae TaxID=2025311 RepID=A0A7K0EFI8_9BACT|nr:efflux RND transporter periplasmic adaptor subunit [Larkinella terrae]MRS60226.1 efflux RND transporter periplasmic adaptor subunit [Larkinella terrae]
MEWTALAILLLSCGRNEEKRGLPKTTERVPVKVMALVQSKQTRIVSTSGQLTTDDETILSFKTGGVVNAVLVKEGDPIRKGQLLATLNLTEINAQVAQARKGYEKAQRDFQRVTNLYQDSVATLEQWQNAETGFFVAKEQLNTASFNRSFSEIHASANGYILHKFVNAGQVVASGSPILLTNGATPGKWLLRAGVSDRQWAMIEAHDGAQVHIDAFPDQTFQARVIRKSKRADLQSGAFTVELEVNSKKFNLATGMFAAVDIQSGASESTWSIPYEAVLDGNDNTGFVFVTNDNKTAIRQPVTIESFNGQTIRISKGLEKAQSLIISGSSYLTDGSRVQIVK